MSPLLTSSRFPIFSTRDCAKIGHRVGVPRPPQMVGFAAAVGRVLVATFSFWLLALACGSAHASPAGGRTAMDFPSGDPSGARQFWALSVEDLEATIAWYTEHLGFRLRHRRTLTDTMDVALLEGHGTLIELLRSETSTSFITAQPQLGGVHEVQGFFKVGLFLDDFDRLAGALNRAGIEILAGPMPDSVLGGQRYLLVRDNNGFLLQLFEASRPEGGHGPRPSEGNSPPATGTTWPGLRGPRHDGSVEADWPSEISLEPLWVRPLGSGYSAIAVEGERIFTLYATEDGRAAADVVAAFGTAAGEELWRLELGPIHRGHDGSHDGPIASPAVGEGSVAALGPRGLLVVASVEGNERWRLDLSEVAEGPSYGFASSPLITGGLVVVQHASPAGMLHAYDLESGERRWSAVEDTVHYQSPLLARLGGREQLLVAGDRLLAGVDPGDGTVLWFTSHGGDDSDMGSRSSLPMAVDENHVWIQSAMHESRLLRVAGDGPNGSIDTAWVSRDLARSYAPPVAFAGSLYGFQGGFLSRVSVAGGSRVWKSRAPGDGFLARAGRNLVVATKQGELHVGEPTRNGWESKAVLEVFSDPVWTTPTIAGSTIYLRSLGQMAAIAVRERRASTRRAAGRQPWAAPARLPDTEFGRFLRRLEKMSEDERQQEVEEFFAAVAATPVVEEPWVHFVLRSQAGDVGLVSDILGSRTQAALSRIPGTDLHVYSAELESSSLEAGAASLAYRFVLDLDRIEPDPANPRTTYDGNGRQVSLFTVGQGRTVRAPRPPIALSPERWRHFPGARTADVLLPASYGMNEKRFPVLYVHGGPEALELGELALRLDAIFGHSLPEALVVFVHPASESFSEIVDAEERRRALDGFFALVQEIDAAFRTREEPSGRAVLGQGYWGLPALEAALRRPDLLGCALTQSAFLMDEPVEILTPLLPAAAASGLEVRLQWGRWDLRAEHEGWSLAESNGELVSLLRAAGVPVGVIREASGFHWEAWQDRLPELLAGSSCLGG